MFHQNKPLQTPRPKAEGEDNSVDNELPPQNAELGIVGENPIKTASDVPGSRRLQKSGAAGGGGSDPGDPQA